ncbi:hypothetical protein ACHAXA_010166 [Cyclostephanos tholiformis]|uniref:Late endosomal/lysosomal adaptor and MAPK and MTOR activator 5 n=1 Tax=Cyclostephanos tholiformis TaxID=382380 RepID=A0ABD3RDP6_9STRA
MIRSRSIPSVLSRATGDGIHAILLIDSFGELIGSHGKPPPLHPSPVDNGGGVNGSAAAAAVRNEKIHWPLDAASIGALVSEVAGDYRRMGEELLYLDPQYDSQRQSMVKGDGGQSAAGLHRQDRDGQSDGGGNRGASSSLLQSDAEGKNGKDKQNSGTNLKSLVIELDYVS